MPSEEWELDKTDAQKVVEHFTGKDPLADVFASIQQVTELPTEADLKAMYERDIEIAALEALNIDTRSRLMRIAKTEKCEFYQKGEFVAQFQYTKGRKTLKAEKVKAFIEEQIGALGDTDLAKLYDEGEPQVRFLGVKRLK